MLTNVIQDTTSIPLFYLTKDDVTCLYLYIILKFSVKTTYILSTCMTAEVPCLENIFNMNVILNL